MAVTIGQAGFRLRNDDGNETTATWKAAQNTNVNIACDLTFRARFLMQNAGTTALANLVAQLEYTLNGGASTNVTAASSVVRATASPNVTDAANITQQLTGGTGTFIGLTGFDEGNGQAGGSSLDIAANGCFEVEFSIQIRSADVANGDTIGLRVTNAGTDFTGTYAQVPAIIATKPVFTTNDAVTVSESVTPKLSIYLSAADTVSLYDLTNQEISYAIIVTDSVTVVFSGATTISVFDSVAIAEGILGGVTALVPAQSDAIAITESVTAFLPKLVIAASESVSIDEGILGGVTVLFSTQFDAIAISDDATLLLPKLLTSQFDAVSLADASALFVAINISANEAVSIAESATVVIIVSASAFDAVAIAESATAFLPKLVIAADEAVTVAESATTTMGIASRILDFSDGVALTDIGTVLITILKIAANDAVAVAEQATIAPAILFVSQADAVAVAESIIAKTAFVPVAASDTITIVEVSSVVVQLSKLAISVFDNINFADDPIPVTASENISATDFAQATGLLYWASAALLGSAASKSANQSSIVLITTDVLEAGACAVVLIAVDNSQGTDGDEGAVTNVFDSVGNLYLKAREFTNGNGAAQAGATISVWYATASLQLNSGSTITAQFSNSTARDAAAITAGKIGLGINGVVAVAGSAVLANDTADPGILDLTLPSASYLWVRAQAHKRPATDIFTQTLSYDGVFDKQGTTGGVATTNMTVAGEVAIKVATSNPSDPSWSSAANEAAVIVAFRLDPAILINMSDAIAANELAIPLIPQLLINANDAVATQEQIIMALEGLVAVLPINTGDAVAIAETGQSIFSRLLVDANDAIALAEFTNQIAGFITARFVQVAENVAVSENIVLGTRIPINVFDNVFLYGFLPNEISVADAVSLSESFNLTGQTLPPVVHISINTFENVVVDIPETHVLEDITVSELAAVIGATGVDWFSIGSLGSALSKSANQATLVLQAGAIAEAGNLLVALIAVDNFAPADGDEGAVSGLVDQAGNAWIKIGEFTNGNGSAQAGATISAWYSLITTQIAQNALITASFTNVTARDAAAMTVWEFGLRRVGFVSVAGVATRADDNSDPGILNLTLPGGENLWVRGQAHERPLTDTWVKTVPWDGIFDKQGTSGGVADTNMTVAGEFRIFNGTSNPSDPSWTSAADEAGIIFAFKLNPSVAPSAFDSVAITEITALRLARLTISANDAVAIAEAVTLTQSGQLATFDNVAIVDAITLRVNLPLAQFEVITITEIATAIISKLVVSSFETVAVADAPIVSTITFPRPDVADAIAVSELSLAILPQLVISVADATIIVTDQVSFLSSRGINSDDSVTVTDLVALHISRLFIAALEPVTVTDPMALELASFGQPFEGEFVFVGDTATLFLATLSIAAFDAVAIADFSSLLIGKNSLDVAESISAADAVAIYLGRLTVSTFDSVAVAELIIPANVNVVVSAADAIGIAENATVLLPKLVVAAGDDIAVADFDQERFTVPVSTFDGVTVLDDATAMLLQQLIVASDNVIVGQFVAAQISIYLSVGDNVALIENTAIVLRVVTLFIEEGDDVSALEEIAQIAHGDPLSVQDSLLLEDAADIMLDRLNIQVADDLALSEQLGEFHGQYVFIDQADDVTVSEHIRPIRRRGRRYTRFTRSSITPKGPTKTDTEI